LLVGFKDRFPSLLLSSLGCRIRFQRVVARFTLQLRITHPPVRRNAAVLQSLSHGTPWFLLMPAIRKVALPGQCSDFRES
jgi:hypothetical protein